MDETLQPSNCGASMEMPFGGRTMIGICGIIYGGGTGQNPRPGLADELAQCPVLSGGVCEVSNRSVMNQPRVQEALRIAQNDASNNLTALIT